MTCNRKHTVYQPTEEEWKCPQCGEKDNFNIEAWDDDEKDEECELLHANDPIECHACGKHTTGKVFAKMLQTKHDLVECPCCKGRGLVSPKEALCHLSALSAENKHSTQTRLSTKNKR